MRIKSYLCSVAILVAMLLPGGVLDYIYHNLEIWRDGTSCLSSVCDWLYQKGFRYSGAFGILKSSFGILVTAISMIVTMSVNILNRSESKVFGLSRKKLIFSRRTIIYEHGRRIIFFAPIVMIIAVNFELCITGYSILAISYLYLLLSYILFDSSFSKEKEEESVIKNLLNSIPDDAQDVEDIASYLTYLNNMRQWNEKESEWEAIEHLFIEICSAAEKYEEKKMYFLCFYFYDVVFTRGSNHNMGRAAEAIKSYIKCMDIAEWKEKGCEYYWILWEMLHHLLIGGTEAEVVDFIKWYLDFPDRSSKIVRKTGHVIGTQNILRQTGILLIELELYFSKNEVSDYYFYSALETIWNQGKAFLEPDEVLQVIFNSANDVYTFWDDDLKTIVQDLEYDYKNRTTRSMITKLLNYKLEV